MFSRLFHNTEVPVGPSTVLGLSAAAAQFAGVIVAVLLEGDHTPETITLLVTATLSLYGVIRSRGEQAAARAKAAPVWYGSSSTGYGSGTYPEPEGTRDA